MGAWPDNEDYIQMVNPNLLGGVLARHGLNTCPLSHTCPLSQPNLSTSE